MKASLILLVLALGLASGCGSKSSRAADAASLEEFNRAASVVMMRTGRIPPSTNEVAKFLSAGGKSLPLPPSGKKLAFDSAQRQFVFADQ